jgi:hypothetical protein
MSHQDDSVGISAELAGMLLDPGNGRR